MDQLTYADLRNLVGAVAILNENLELSTLAHRTVNAVSRLLPADMVTYNEVDLVQRVDRIFVTPDDSRLAAGTAEYAAFIRHIDDHPVVAHNARTADPVPRKISDFLNDRKFRSLALHSEFFRIFDVNYQIVLVMHHAGKRMVGIALNRTLSDFTERERACLTALRAHVVQSYAHGLLVGRIRAECGAKRAAHTPAGEDVAALSQREAEVLHWVARGKSNDDVARIIGTSTATVKKHLEHVYQKLGVRNRTAASAIYMRIRGN